MGREKLILDVDELVEVSELWCTKIKPPTNESHPPVPFQVTWGNHSQVSFGVTRSPTRVSAPLWLMLTGMGTQPLIP
jgi:hypothetical protein